MTKQAISFPQVTPFALLEEERGVTRNEYAEDEVQPWQVTGKPTQSIEIGSGAAAVRNGLYPERELALVQRRLEYPARNNQGRYNAKGGEYDTAFYKPAPPVGAGEQLIKVQ